MPHYDYLCPDCGETVCDVYQGMNDPHVYTCSCGQSMGQIYSPPMITGELPTIGCWNGYYDHSLGAKITSKRQRDDLMKMKGLREYSPTPEQEALSREANYITKHAPKDQVRHEVNKVAKGVEKVRNDKRTIEFAETVVGPAVEKAIATVGE